MHNTKNIDCNEWWNSELYMWSGDLHDFIISLLFNKNQALCLNCDSDGWMQAVQHISRAYREKYLYKFYKTLYRQPLCVSIFYLYWLLLLWYYEIKLGACCSNLISPFWLWEAFLYVNHSLLSYDELYQVVVWLF